MARGFNPYAKVPRRRTPRVAAPQLTQTPPTEAAFLRQVLEIASYCGFDFAYHSWTSVHSAGGYPDLCLARSRDGRVVFIELKGPKTRLRPKQQEWIDLLNRASRPDAYLWRAGEITAQEIADLLSGSATREDTP